MKLRKNDIYLIIVVVILGIAAGLYIYLNKKPGGKAVLKYGNNQSMDIDLSKDGNILLYGSPGKGRCTSIYSK